MKKAHSSDSFDGIFEKKSEAKRALRLGRIVQFLQQIHRRTGWAAEMLGRLACSRLATFASAWGLYDLSNLPIRRCKSRRGLRSQFSNVRNFRPILAETCSLEIGWSPSTIAHLNPEFSHWARPRGRVLSLCSFPPYRLAWLHCKNKLVRDWPRSFECRAAPPAEEGLRCDGST
jgi:hypothetical protein